MNTKRITQSAALGLVLAAVRSAGRRRPAGHPHARSDRSGSEALQDRRNPDTIDAAAGRGTEHSPDVMVVRIPPTAPSAATSAEGLDWQDAGIGAGGLLALGLIGLGGTLLVVHHRRGAATAPSAH